MCQASGAGLVIIRSDTQGDRNGTHQCGCPARLDFEQAARVLICPKSMCNVSWKVERCSKCHQFAVKSKDEFWGCLKCRELPKDQVNQSLHGGCVYCGQPLILLMEACLTCGNQPRQ
ncbi:MAG: hypothetical protein KME25_00545 [Symplocastrum torsivum CPER-KK1]|uniref:Uncharacterized protein n=1 Tax=Symplocastrum torsivum CPER-KK1 TaxID=450513 RepID=A0A951PG08_9CYAN|nr:hypothetical protein [Symplocastrum torsivum CPER-KK1]